MFRATSKHLISSYFRFLMEMKGKLPDVPVPERGRALAKLYRALTEEEKAKLVARAKQTEHFSGPRTESRKKKPHAYRLFLKAYAKTHWAGGNRRMTWGSQAKKAAAAYRKYKAMLAAKGGKLSGTLDESIIRQL